MMESEQPLTFHALDGLIRARGDALYGERKTHRGWEPLRWAELRHAYLMTAVLLRRLHPGKPPVVGILAGTRFEWNVCDLATLAIGGIVAGFYSEDRDEVLEHGLSVARPDILVVMDEDLLCRIRSLAPQWGVRRPVVVMEPVAHPSAMLHDLQQWLAGPVDAAQLAAVENGIPSLPDHHSASYIFTSGTAGLPKAVILTQRNLLHSAAVYARHFPISAGDSSLVYLPFAHVFARVLYYASLVWGIRLHYTRRLNELVDDFQTVNPTIILAVPRLLEKVQAGIEARVAAGNVLSRHLFTWATGVGRRYHGEGRRGPVLALQLRSARWLVLGKVARLFGRRQRFIGCGGGHLPASVTRFFQQFGIAVYEGYATTESGGLGIFNYPGMMCGGTVGRPVPEVALSLASDGEIRLRSASVVAGDLNDAAATAKVFEDGWLLTGDIGQFDGNGFLVVEDRKKDLLVTAYGKNVAPSWLEEQLMTNAAIDDAVVFGDGRPYLVALIVPSELLLARYGRDFHHLALRDAVGTELERINAGLSRHERIHCFALVASFDIVSGTMTSIFKKRRNAIYQRYQADIESLYKCQAKAVAS